jgi:hypothetical protein
MSGEDAKTTTFLTAQKDTRERLHYASLISKEKHTMPSSPKENHIQSDNNGVSRNPMTNCLDVLLLHQSRECTAATSNRVASLSDLGNTPSQPLITLCQALDKALEICGGATDEALLAMTRQHATSASSSLTVRDPPRTQ